MNATHGINVTNQMIKARLNDVIGCSVEWTGRMPADCEEWDDLAAKRLFSLDVFDVRDAFEHELVAETAEEELDMAISIASEPDDLPIGGMVDIVYIPITKKENYNGAYQSTK